jgi:hypothetical protein
MRYEFSEREAETLHKLVDTEIRTMKNFVVNAVEQDRLEDAKLLIVKVRELEKLFAKTNVEAHRDIAKLAMGGAK